MRIHSRTALNVALALLVAAAGAFLFLHPEPEAPQSYPILPARLEEVRRIEIERASGMRIVLARDDRQWRMQAPLAARLDEIALARVLDIGRAHAAERLEGQDLQRFELDKPWARVRFDAHAVEFGMSNTLTQELYVRSGSHVYALPVRYASNIPGDASKLLAHRLFGADEQPVAFKLAAFSVREENGRWQLDPHKDDISQDDLMRWVDHWRLASSIITQPQTDARPRQTLEIGLRDGRVLALHVTQLAPDLVVRRDDERLEYHFPARLASVLLAPPGTAADKKKP